MTLLAEAVAQAARIDRRRRRNIVGNQRALEPTVQSTIGDDFVERGSPGDAGTQRRGGLKNRQNIQNFFAWGIRLRASRLRHDAVFSREAASQQRMVISTVQARGVNRAVFGREGFWELFGGFRGEIWAMRDDGPPGFWLGGRGKSCRRVGGSRR